MRWTGFGGGRDPDAAPGSWLPHGELWVAIGTAVAGVAVVASVLASGGHRRAGAKVTAAPTPSVTSVPGTSRPASPTTPPPTTAAPRTTVVTARTVPPTTPPTSPPTTGRPAWTPDPLLTGLLPSQSQLGAGWSAVAGPSTAGGAPSTAGPCPDDPLPYADEGATLGITFNDGVHQAAAAVTLYRLATPVAAAKEAAFTGSLGVVPCLGVSAARDSAPYPWLGELEGTEFTDGRAPVALRQHGDAALLTVTAQVDGSSRSAQWAFVHQYAGRYEALTVVSWCTCTPLPPAALQHVVDLSGAAVATLAAKAP
jgi:hypothetical protein